MASRQSNTFKEISARPLTGIFDALNPVDLIGFQNFSLAKNVTIRGYGKRKRSGGWTKLFTDRQPYSNFDLHDQLINDQLYQQPVGGNITVGGDLEGYIYQYYSPPYTIGGYPYLAVSGPFCGYYPNVNFGSCEAFLPFVGYPYQATTYGLGPCFYNGYQSSYYYIACMSTFPETDYPGGFYGPYTPFYSPFETYPNTSCYPYQYTLDGCREAITMINEVVSEGIGRKLVVATMSRIYALNEITGNWKILADGLGNSVYNPDQCTCNDVVMTSTVMGSFILFTNGFNEPLLWKIGDENKGCDLWAAQPIPDLQVIGLSQAGGAIAWKGFMILFDVTLDGEKKGGTIVWSDFDDPTSYIPSDTSSAGQSTIAVGEQFLAAAALGDYLYLFSDRSIWRVTLLAGDLIFNFTRIYTGTSALKYKHSLVNTGQEILYLGLDHIYSFSQHDTRPLAEEIEWIDKVSPVIYQGINEDDASFGPINESKCNQVVGGWNERYNEVWFSWPTDNNSCPNQSLRLNVQYKAADLVDHGFTAFHAYRSDDRPTVASFLEQYGACTFEDLLDSYLKEGAACPSATMDVLCHPTVLWNETEDPNLPPSSNSFCACFGSKTEDDFCLDCGAPTRFVMADAWDFCLKEYAEDSYYRERYIGIPVEGYTAYSCDQYAYYVADGYDSVLQSGANDFGTDEEKLIKRITVEYNALPQTIPNQLFCYVGFSAQAVCDTWISLEPQDLHCLTCFTDQQRSNDNLRADSRAHFPTFYRGKYLHWRIKVSGTGGGSSFSEIVQVVKGAEMNTSR